MSDKQEGTAAIVKAVDAALIPLTPETVRAYINAKATPQEIAMFINICGLYQLNPFKREAYLIKYGNEPASIVTGYEVYLKRAERSKKWAGFEDGTVEDPTTKLPAKAWVKVYRKDWGDRPLYHEVLWAEYAQYHDESKWNEQTKRSEKTGNRVLNRMWAEKPHTMLKKVAIEQGHRMAFPDEFAGMPYAIEEAGIDEDLLRASMTTIDAAQADYQRLKAQPVKDIKDEFGGPPDRDGMAADGSGPEDEPSNAPDKPAPSMAALEKFAKVVADLKALGISEESIWAGIHKFTGETLGIVVTEDRDFTTEQLEMVTGYLHRRKKATEADKAKLEAAVKGGAK